MNVIANLAAFAGKFIAVNLASNEVVARAETFDALVEAMDAAGIEDAAIMSVPDPDEPALISSSRRCGPDDVRADVAGGRIDARAVQGARARTRWGRSRRISCDPSATAEGGLGSVKVGGND